jgi:hypothetical protein
MTALEFIISYVYNLIVDDNIPIIYQDMIQIIRTPDARLAKGLYEICTSQQKNLDRNLFACAVINTSKLGIQLVIEML